MSLSFHAGHYCWLKAEKNLNDVKYIEHKKVLIPSGIEPQNNAHEFSNWINRELKALLESHSPNLIICKKANINSLKNDKSAYASLLPIGIISLLIEETNLALISKHKSNSFFYKNGREKNESLEKFTSKKIGEHTPHWNEMLDCAIILLKWHFDTAIQ
jgi:hypothetical protein